MNPPSPTLELLSVHVPKCGGASLLTALGRAYGDALLWDYGDRPGDPASPMNLDPDGFYERTHASLPQLLQGKRAVHGHFHPRKYEPVRVAFRTAIIREPIARLVSHFYYWKTYPKNDHNLQKYFLEQNLDLESFARLPLIRYFYSRVFFAGTRLDDFNYIGTLENFSQSVATIGRGTGVPIELGAIENLGGTPEYQEALARIAADAGLRGRLHALLADDLRFYASVRDRWP